jgi:hypothetical protein
MLATDLEATIHAQESKAPFLSRITDALFLWNCQVIPLV